MKIYNEKGFVQISKDVFAAITGGVATQCFGVKGMATKNITNDLVLLLRGEQMSKGVKVEFSGQTVNIELHIVVKYGINISVVCQSIINEVSFTVSRLTGVKVGSVVIFVDSIAAE